MTEGSRGIDYKHFYWAPVKTQDLPSSSEAEYPEIKSPISSGAS